MTSRRMPFQYMLLLRGATGIFYVTASPYMFQYMLLLRGATQLCLRLIRRNSFQYMLLLRGATFLPHRLFLGFLVSIHAPLARSNTLSGEEACMKKKFQYMLLLRGATGLHKTSNRRSSFNTCSSCEEQHPSFPEGWETGRFNTCSSCEEQLAMRRT